jgi:hypothetical protein
MNSVYDDVSEEVPKDAPAPLGKTVMTTMYADANIYHDWTTGRAVTGTLHFRNGTPIDWFSKRQNTVETATYGSNFVAARIATNQVIDLQLTLQYLGVPVSDKSYMFGDNKSVVTSSTIPHSKLNKRHNALLYHRVREAIAAKIIDFLHINGKTNPANVLSKHCGHVNAWPHLKWLLFWQGAPQNKWTVFRVKKGRHKFKSPVKWFLFRILWGPCNSKARGHFKYKYILIPFGAMVGSDKIPSVSQILLLARESSSEFFLL